MMEVCIQGGKKNRSFDDNSYPRMAMTVNPSFVALGNLEPTFQITVVPRKLLLLITAEQAWQETLHDFGGMLLPGVRIVGQTRLDFSKPLFSNVLGARLWG